MRDRAERSWIATFCAVAIFAVLSRIDGFFWQLSRLAFESLFDSWRSAPISYFAPSLGIPLAILFLKASRGRTRMLREWSTVRDTIYAAFIVLIPFYLWHLLWKVPHEITEAARNTHPPWIVPIAVPPKWDQRGGGSKSGAIDASNVLSYDAELLPSNLEVGSAVYTVKWVQGYSGVTLYITNNALFGIDNLDVSVSLDGYIDRLEQMRGLSKTDQGTHEQFPAGQITFHNADGKEITHASEITIASARYVRIFCQHITRRETLGFIIATSDVLPSGGTNTVGRPPDFLNMGGTFETGAVEGSKRFSVKWRQTFKSLPEGNVSVIKRRINQAISESSQLPLTTDAQVQWVRTLGAYFDGTLGHACSFSVYAIPRINLPTDVALIRSPAIGPSDPQRVAALGHQRDFRVAFQRKLATQTSYAKMAALCEYSRFP
jgi:hypothetical protein